ncbi:MAG: AMP-binding protein [Proteobacteria bacterium]|nr:AMP-binding protein [Pseudomonadota bacterium]
MTLSYTPETARKIDQARTVHGRAFSDTLAKWPNFAHLFKSQVVARGDQTYLIYRNGDERQKLTYREMFTRMCRTAHFMRDKLALKAGDRIVTVAYNHVDTVVATFAAWMIGATVVPFNAGEADERLVFAVNNADTKAIFVMPDMVARVEALRDQFEQVPNYVQINGELVNAEYLSMSIECQYGNPDEASLMNLANLNTEALIVYTSGTTGAPKGVVLDQQNIIVCCQSIADWHRITPEHRFMLVLPIHHVNGLMVTLVTPVVAGASTVLNHKFSASNYWRVAAEEKANCGSVVPTVLSFLCEAGKDNFTAAKCGIEFLICGAGPLTVQTVERFEDAFGVEVVHGYGLSETTVYTCYIPRGLPKAEHDKWLRSFGYPAIGIPISCNEMDIQDPMGKSVPEGEKGEIVIRGQNVMKCYYKRPDANADSFTHGWFRSGDEGFFKKDAQGNKYFFITGRLKELIIRGGVNYSPLEIDEVINRIPGVKAGMAVGFENNMYGEEIGAYVVKENPALTEQDVLDACAKELSFSKRPKVVVFGDEFPVTSTGKYQRLKLKGLFAQWKDTQFRDSSKQKTA